VRSAIPIVINKFLGNRVIKIMASENQRNQSDYKSVLPDTAALENHADRLIDDLFADIDDILADGTKLPGQTSTPAYPALKSGNVPQITLPPGTSTSGENLGLPPFGYSQASLPQDRLGGGSSQAPTLIPNLTPDIPPHSPEVTPPNLEEPETAGNEEMPSEVPEEESRIPAPPVPTASPNAGDRILSWGIGATFAALVALFFLWLVSQYRLNVLRTANTTNSQTPAVSQEEKDFIDYMEKALKAIDRKSTITPSQPATQTLPPASTLPVLTPPLPSASSVPIPVPEPPSKR
jgi:hypothetical protein